MQKTAPSKVQIGIALAFAFSCFGLLLFLWNAFGGPIPFAPQGYRFTVPIDEATNLAEESDVRISGVSVGQVKQVELGEGDTRDLALATIELDAPYAPIPQNTRAVLRTKTLLGEAYIELSPGDESGPKLPEDGELPPAQVGDSVQLDEIFRAFDPTTRVAFQNWMQQGAIALKGRGADISAAIGNLEPLAEDANRLLRVLDTQDDAVNGFVRDTGVVFHALSERKGQLRGLVQNSSQVFATTARRDQDLRDTFTVLPTFLDETKLTLERLDQFAADTNPLITQLRPSARELSGTLNEVSDISPELRTLFEGISKLAPKSQRGLPALRKLLDDDLPPLLAQAQPFTQQLSPIIEGIGRYRREITGLLGNGSAIANAGGTGSETNNQPVRYIRGAATVSPEDLAVFPDDRLAMNRSNPYVAPGGALKALSGGYDSFETRFCAGPPGLTAALDPNTALDPDFAARATRFSPQLLFDQLKLYAFNDTLSTATTPAPACDKQAPQRSIGEIPELSDYLHIYRYAP